MANNTTVSIERQITPAAKPPPIEVAPNAALPSGGESQGLKPPGSRPSFSADRSGLLAMARALYLREDTRRSKGFPHVAEERMPGNQGLASVASGVAGMPWQVTGYGCLPSTEGTENVSFLVVVGKEGKGNAKHWKRCTEGRRSSIVEDNIQFPDKSNPDLFWTAEKP